MAKLWFLLYTGINSLCVKQMCAIPKMRALTSREKDFWTSEMESVESNAVLRFLSYYNDIETLASLGPFFCEYSSLNILLIGYEKHFVFLMDWMQFFIYIFQLELNSRSLYREFYNSCFSKWQPSCCSPPGDTCLWGTVSSYIQLPCCSLSLHVWLCCSAAVAIFKWSSCVWAVHESPLKGNFECVSTEVEHQ